MTRAGLINPLWLRLTHWINAVAVVVLVMSGWRIYNASPLFGFSFPEAVTLGGWLAGALLWHFAAMWVLALNGLVYLTVNLFSGRAGRRLLPLRGGDVMRDLRAALHARLHHDDGHYNSLQKLAYLFVVVDLLVLVLSGLTVWKPVQFPLLRQLFGDYEGARLVHFFAMVGLIAFFAVHVVMAALVPRSLLLITRGR